MSNGFRFGVNARSDKDKRVPISGISIWDDNCSPDRSLNQNRIVKAGSPLRIELIEVKAQFRNCYMAVEPVSSKRGNRTIQSSHEQV